VHAHGANFGCYCAKCFTDWDRKELEEHMEEGEVLYCNDPKCRGPCKPNIVFTSEGEKMQDKFMGILMDLEG